MTTLKLPFLSVSGPLTLHELSRSVRGARTQVIPIERGGTGQTTAEEARGALGIQNPHDSILLQFLIDSGE